MLLLPACGRSAAASARWLPGTRIGAAPPSASASFSGRRLYSLARPGASTTPSSSRRLSRAAAALQRAGGNALPPRPPGGAPLRAVATSSPASATPPPSSSSTGPRVCVLGGGFGGLYTAVRLEDLMWPRGTRPRVTLIDRGDRFVFKPLLYELLNGGASADEVAPRFDKLLASTRVAFIRGGIDRVEEAAIGASTPASPSGGTVVLSDGTTVEYDWLVLALGGETTTFGVPGAADLALPFSSFEDAVEVDARLTELEARVAASGRAGPGDGVVVVGAGYAGVELAATVAERLAGSLTSRGLPAPPVTVVTYSDDILDGAPPGQRAAAAAQLASSGVAVRTRVAVSRVTASPGPGGPTAARTVHLRGTAGNPDSREASAGGDATLEAGLVLWTAGTGPVTRSDGGGPALPFPRSPRGAIRVEPTLRIVGHPRAFALGDVAGVEAALNGGGGGGSSVANESSPSPPPLAPTAQVAFQQADYAAWNVWSSINARRLLPFRYQHLGEMMSLGKKAGAVTLPVPVPAGLASALAKSPLGGLLGAVGVRLPTEPDAPTSGLTLEGPLAGALRRAAYWYRQPTGGQRVSVGREWLAAVAGEVAGAVRRRGGGGGGGGGAE